MGPRSDWIGAQSGDFGVRPVLNSYHRNDLPFHPNALDPSPRITASPRRAAPRRAAPMPTTHHICPYLSCPEAHTRTPFTLPNFRKHLANAPTAHPLPPPREWATAHRLQSCPHCQLPFSDRGISVHLKSCECKPLGGTSLHNSGLSHASALPLPHPHPTDMLGRTGRGKVHFGDHAGWGSAEFLTKFGKTLGQFEAKTGEFQKVDFYFCCGISDFGCYHGILEKQHLADGHLKSTISLIIQKQANFKCGNL